MEHENNNDIMTLQTNVKYSQDISTYQYWDDR